jgi:hypothetical protein
MLTQTVPPKQNRKGITLKQSQLTCKGGFPVHTAKLLKIKQ